MSRTKYPLSAKQFSGLNAVLAAAVLGIVGLFAVFGADASGNPALAYNYSTPVTSNSNGAVFACKSEKYVHIKAMSTGGTGLSWWYDSQPASSSRIKASGTTYKKAAISGSNFTAYIWRPGSGGYGPAELPVVNINVC